MTRSQLVTTIWNRLLAEQPNLTSPRLVRLVANETGFTTSEVLALRFPIWK